MLIVTRDGIRTEQEIEWEFNHAGRLGKCPHCLTPYVWGPSMDGNEYPCHRCGEPVKCGTTS